MTMGPRKRGARYSTIPAQRVGVRGGKLIHRVDDVRLDDDVLLLAQLGQDLVIDGSERRANVLAAVVALHDRDPRNPGEFLHHRRDGKGGRGLRTQSAGRRQGEGRFRWLAKICGGRKSLD